MKIFGRETFLSLLLHSLLIASVFAVGYQIDTCSESIVVFLGADGGGSKAGGGGSLGSEKDRKKIASQLRQSRAVAASPARTSSTSPRLVEPAVQTGEKQEELLTKAPSERDVTGVSEALRTAMVEGARGVGSAGSGGGSGGGSGTGSGRGEGSGFGSGTGAGSGYGHGEGYGEGNARSRYLREHFAYIRDLIVKHLVYPPLAKKFGWMGSLTVSFVIHENGSAELIRIVKSSGYEVLDQNVVRTIKHLQPFPKPPVKAELVIPVMYRLQ